VQAIEKKRDDHRATAQERRKSAQVIENTGEEIARFGTPPASFSGQERVKRKSGGHPHPRAFGMSIKTGELREKGFARV